MALTNARASLVPLHVEMPLPPIAWEVETPASVAMAWLAPRLPAAGILR
jgi:hypothetical protein